MVSAETFIDREKDLTVISFAGEITGHEIIAEMEEYYSGRTTTMVIWEFSRVKGPGLSTEELQAVAAAGRKYSEVRRGGKSAIVASEDLMYGLSRMYEAFTEMDGHPVKNKVFRSMEEARQWLEIPG